MAKDKGSSGGTGTTGGTGGTGTTGGSAAKGGSGGGAAVADTAMSAAGSYVPWAEIVRQIVGHVVRGGGAALQYTATRRAVRSAWDQANMTNMLGIVDMKLEEERQTLRRQAMMESLEAIDEGFGYGTSETAVRNRRAIRTIINQIERADAERSAGLLTREGEDTARRQRQHFARRGGGGSVEEATARERAAGLAVARGEAQEGTRQAGKREESRLAKRRAGMRDQARTPIEGMRPGFTTSKGWLRKMVIDEAAEQTPYKILNKAVQEGGKGLGGVAEIITGVKSEAAFEESERERLKKEKEERELAELLREMRGVA